MTHPGPQQPQDNATTTRWRGSSGWRSRSSEDPSADASEEPRPAASVTARVFHGLLGGLLGATIGYGLVTSGPGPAPSLLSWEIIRIIGGLAAICGGLAAASPRAFWRPRWRP